MKRNLFYICCIFLYSVLLFSGCSTVSYIPPMFGYIDDIYTETSEIDENENFTADLDADLELDYIKSYGFFTTGSVDIFSLQAAGAGGLTFRTSENNFLDLNLAAGIIGGMAIELSSASITYSMTDFLPRYSLGGFAQVDVMFGIEAGRQAWVPGVSYTLSYEALGNYLNYRRNVSTADLGQFDQFCSQFIIYCDYSDTIGRPSENRSLFLRPFIGFSNIASFNPFSAPDFIREILKQADAELDILSQVYIFSPDYGFYV